MWQSALVLKIELHYHQVIAGGVLGPWFRGLALYSDRVVNGPSRGSILWFVAFY